jgi:putative addiction module component (TIGR02574 family)
MTLGSAMGEPSFQIDLLSSQERLELLERLWESLSRAPAEVPLTAAQRAELDRRSEALDRDLTEGRAIGLPWEEVVRQLRPGR